MLFSRAEARKTGQKDQSEDKWQAKDVLFGWKAGRQKKQSRSETSDWGSGRTDLKCRLHPDSAARFDKGPRRSSPPSGNRRSFRR